MDSLTELYTKAEEWAEGAPVSFSNFCFVGDHLYCLKNKKLFCCQGDDIDQMHEISFDVREKFKLSKEEEMLRERLRQDQSGGIDSFSLVESRNALLVEAQGRVFLMDLQDRSFKEIVTEQEGARLHTSVSGKVFGFVRNHNVFLTNLETGEEIQVSDAASDAVVCGEGDFIHQEEFSLYRAYWIAPASPESETVRVLYLEFDSSKVQVHSIPNPGIDGTVDAFRYPKVGSRNASISVKLATVDLKSKQVTTTVLKDALCDWAEYVGRAGWSKKGEFCWLNMTDRKQRKTAIVKLDFQSKREILYQDETSTFVDLGEDYNCPLHFLDDHSFFIVSERIGGFAHVYLVKPDHSVRAITSGDWGLQFKLGWSSTLQFWVDERKKAVFFCGLKDSVLEKQLYWTSYEEGKECSVQRLSELGWDHAACVVGDDRIIMSSSNLSSPTIFEYFNLDAQNSVSLISQTKGSAKESSFYGATPKLFQIEKNGFVLHGMTYFPRDYDPAKTYPTVVYTYGGPGPKLVTNSYGAVRSAASWKRQTLVNMGFVVSVLDNRGSGGRGNTFGSELYLRMGTVDIEDQVSHVEYLVEQKIADSKRVAIYGASYGGYMSLLAMCKHKNVFKIGYAFSPVTLWEAYDTGYTERFMLTPDENPKGYKQGNILEYAKEFPDEENRLVIFHGLADENVHFAHTSVLVAKLAEHLKPYDLQVYPEGRHGIGRGSKHAWIKVMRHLNAHLK
jgi:dipeptidyl-peptidase 9